MTDRVQEIRVGEWIFRHIEGNRWDCYDKEAEEWGIVCSDPEIVLLAHISTLEQERDDQNTVLNFADKTIGELTDQCALLEPVVEAAEKVNWKLVIDALSENNLVPLSVIYIEDLTDTLAALDTAQEQTNAEDE